VLGLISFAFVVLFVIWASDDDDLAIIDRASAVYVSVLNLLTTTGFVLYALRLYFIMRDYHFPIDLRRKKATRVSLLPLSSLFFSFLFLFLFSFLFFSFLFFSLSLSLFFSFLFFAFLFFSFLFSFLLFSFFFIFFLTNLWVY